MTTKTLLSTGRSFLQKASVSGTTRSCIVGPTTGSTVADVLRVALWDGTGRAVEGGWPLQNVSNNVTAACCCLVQDRLIVSTKIETGGADFNKTLITEFKLALDPFAAPPTFVSQMRYGDADSRSTELVKLQSGEVVSVTVQQHDLKVCAAVRSVAGAWTAQGLFTLSPETGNSTLFSATAAPWASNELWVFDNLDGGKGCAAGIFNVVGGQLKLTRSIPVLVSSALQPASEWNWNGELVWPAAATDSFRNIIHLSYTNQEFIPGVQQQAFPVEIGIHQDGTWEGLHKGPEVVVSIKNQLPLAVTAGGVALNYRAGNPAVTLVAGANRIQTRDGQVAWNPFAQEFVYAQPDTTKAGTFEVVPGPIVLTTLGGPTPVPTPDAIIVESPLSDLSWSGADPTNAGTFMLQSGPSATGPWTDITNHWPTRFQNVNAKQQVGVVIKVKDQFYRLTPKV